MVDFRNVLTLAKIASGQNPIDPIERNFFIGSGLGALASGGLNFSAPGQLGIRAGGALRGATVGIGALALSRLYELMKRRQAQSQGE